MVATKHMGEVNMKSRVRTRTHGSERGRGFLSPTYSIKLQFKGSGDPTVAFLKEIEEGDMGLVGELEFTSEF